MTRAGGKKIIFVQRPCPKPSTNACFGCRVSQIDQEMELPFEVLGMGKLQINGNPCLRIKAWGCGEQVPPPAKSPVADELWDGKTPAFAAILCLIFTSVPLEDPMLSLENSFHFTCNRLRHFILHSRDSVRPRWMSYGLNS